MAEVETTRTDEIRYRRVRGLRSTLTLSHSALFTAPDHLLLCDYRSGFTERYKRFYFRDIEAVIIRKTQNWMASMAGWGFAGFGFLLIATATHWSRFLQVMEAICALFFLRNLIRGPSCRTHIQTAVQTDALPMLKRVRKTQRVLRSLFPLVAQAQEQPQPVASHQAQATPTSPAATTASVQFAAALTIPDTEPRHELRRFPIVSFALVLLSGLTAIWEAIYPSDVSLIVLTVLFSASTVCAFITLIRQARRRVHRGAAAVAWVIAIGNIIGVVAVNAAYTMFYSIVQARIHAATHARGPLLVPALTPFRLRHMPGFQSVLWIYGLAAVLLALLGLVFALMPPPAKAQPPPLPGKARR
jgi:hypothetical protein